MIYLDNAATSLFRGGQVGEAVNKALGSYGSPGRGSHKPALDAARGIYEARRLTARLFHAESPSRIAFCLNATEALNIAVQTMLEPGCHVLSTQCEHNSVLRPLYMMRERGVESDLLPADGYGRLDYRDFARLLKPNTRAVIITHVSNVTGNITDLAFAADFARSHGLLLIVDAAQSAGHLPIDVQGMGIDVLCFSGHKGLQGPQGTGGIYIREGINPRPFKAGGTGVQSFLEQQPPEMPTVLEAGTPNGHGLAGMGRGVEYILRRGVDSIHAHEQKLMEIFTGKLRYLPNIRFYGDPDLTKRSSIVALNIDGLDSGTASDLLWNEFAVCVRGGVHCAPLMHRALGTAEQGAVRFSFGPENDEEDALAAAEAVAFIASGAAK